MNRTINYWYSKDYDLMRIAQQYGKRVKGDESGGFGEDSRMPV